MVATGVPPDYQYLRVAAVRDGELVVTRWRWWHTVMHSPRALWFRLRWRQAQRAAAREERRQARARAVTCDGETPHRHDFAVPEVRRNDGPAGDLHGWRCACGTMWFPARGERRR